MLKTLGGKITLVDFIPKEATESLEIELGKTGKVTKNKDRQMWVQIITSGGGEYDLWNFNEIPSSLNFFQKITIRVISYRSFPFPLMLEIDGIFSNETITVLDSLDVQSCRQKIENFRQDFWNYWKNNFSIGVLSNEKNNYFGYGQLRFYFEIRNTSEIISETNNAKQFSKQLRENPTIQKFSVNYGGLLSITEYFSNKITIVGQGYSVFGSGHFDFSWITTYEFVTDPGQIIDLREQVDLIARHDNLFELQLMWLWSLYRISQISKWKNKIDYLSQKIKNLEKSTHELEKEIDISSILTKSEFLSDFTSILDEQRFIDRYIEYQRSRYADRIGGEIPLIEDSFPDLKHYGFLFNFYEDISTNTKTIREEYTVLDRQFEILSSHLTQVITTASIRSNQRLERSNQRTQKISFWTNIIATSATVIMLGLTIHIVILTQGMYDESQDTTKILQELGRTNDLLLASLYNDFDLDLKYEIHPFIIPDSIGGRMYDLEITNLGKFKTNVTSSWYLFEATCDENNNLKYLDRDTLFKQRITKSSIIRPDGIGNHFMELYKIHPNYTNSKPFVIEIASLGMPVTPDGKVIEDLKQFRITRVQFNYDQELKNWIPKLGWYELKCDDVPRVGSSHLQLYTKNPDQFQRLD